MILLPINFTLFTTYFNTLLPTLLYRYGRFWWVILLPINFTLYFTVPDVRWKNGWEKYYIFTFFMSIVWIAVYAFFMVRGGFV